MVGERPPPTKEALRAAVGKTVRDVIAPELDVLFCGINPGLYSAAVRHHFARPGNRFWPTLCAAGFTDRIYAPFEERQLLQVGCGITNIVARATAAADELSAAELIDGARRLTIKARRYRPRALAVLGIDAYRAAFRRPKVSVGRQPEALHGIILWVLPNPSGLNAHYKPRDLERAFRALHEAVLR
jgi:TDG/mug DNA glycosylase family protein